MLMFFMLLPRAAQFIRQQWRMWIETSEIQPPPAPQVNSFASNGECGLKLRAKPGQLAVVVNSFASNGECGLKLCLRVDLAHVPCNSFASNGECGLKLCNPQQAATFFSIHSPAMANVD